MILKLSPNFLRGHLIVPPNLAVDFRNAQFWISWFWWDKLFCSLFMTGTAVGTGIDFITSLDRRKFYHTRIYTYFIWFNIYVYSWKRKKILFIFICSNTIVFTARIQYGWIDFRGWLWIVESCPFFESIFRGFVWWPFLNSHFYVCIKRFLIFKLKSAIHSHVNFLISLSARIFLIGYYFLKIDWNFRFFVWITGCFSKWVIWRDCVRIPNKQISLKIFHRQMLGISMKLDNDLNEIFSLNFNA